jgi:signal recognition particle GTPase
MGEPSDQGELSIEQYRAILAVNVKLSRSKLRGRAQYAEWIRRTERQVKIINAMGSEERAMPFSMNLRRLMQIAMTADVTLDEVRALLADPHTQSHLQKAARRIVEALQTLRRLSD